MISEIIVVTSGRRKSNIIAGLLLLIRAMAVKDVPPFPNFRLEKNLVRKNCFTNSGHERESSV